MTRIAFVGAVEGSAVALEALIAADLAPSLLVTLPPEAAGRHSDYADLAPTAAAAGAEIHFTRNVNALETIGALAEARPDVTLVVGWSQICHAPFRKAARLATLGYHPAPLPRFRGRAVIPWTILAGEEGTGSTIFELDAGVDSGPIVAQRLFPVDPEETARSLYEKHKAALAELVPEAVRRVVSGDRGRAQDETRATWCARRVAEDGLVDWREPAPAILRLIRAVGDPYPGAFSLHRGERVHLDAARPFSGPGRFVGMAGQVQTHTERGFTVLCGDGAAIEITAWRNSGTQRPKLHTRFQAA